ncbi:MAG TPA: hypothetical protein VHM26_04660 [Chitinophagaceae bacterium]|jgi:hypothetical protein|nr:hypothetical protein [Chitinophagaceae bacterium]
MTWNHVMGLIATVAMSLPILVLLVTRLASHRIFPALVLYYFTAVIHNMMGLGYIQAKEDYIRFFGIANNLLDAPLMLTFLTYFANSQLMKNRMRILTIGFVAFEILVLSIWGFSRESITIILGPGIALVLSFSIPFFVRHTKMTITHHKAMGKSLMLASLIFAYGCYTIIYVMHYLLNSKNIADTFLVYYFVSTFSSILMAAGVFVERKRIKKFSELKIVRRELSQIYSNEKTAAPLRPAVFDFDKDQWN